MELLNQVGIPDPGLRVNSYPHEMSGGQQQRVMIAMAIACEPKLLIADEPTTALDVTIQKQILDLLAKLQEKHRMSVLFITHDLGVVGDIADTVVVMQNGVVQEQGDVKQIFVSGQSAGGHLVSLLATDETYLKAEGAKISDIKGVLTLSGVYTLPARIAAALPGVGGIPNGKDGMQARRAPFSSVFGSDPKIVRAAAPISHIHAGLPPFLVLYAQSDPKLLREMAVEFAGALEKQKQPVELVEASDRNHISEIVLLGQKGDPVERAMTSFLKKHAKLP